MPDSTPAMRAWFTHFASQYYADVLKLCRALCSRCFLGVDCAEDLAQDVFYIARKRLGTLVSHPNPKAWLYQTVSYAFNNALHKARRRGTKQAYSLDEPRRDIEDAEAEASMVRVLDTAGREELQDAVYALSAADRLLYEQIYHMHLTPTMLAKQYRISSAALYKRQERMQQRLRSLLEEKMLE